MPDYQEMLTEIIGMIEQAGRDIILPGFKSAIRSQTKLDGSVVTEIDTACQQDISSRLAILDQGISFLGEEMDESSQIKCLAESGGRFWCLDPLDGTTNFVAGIPVFGTSLALIENGEPVLACIHDPVRKETFTALRGRGAKSNGIATHASVESELSRASGYIDFKRLKEPEKQRMIIPGIYRSQRNIGSCALEWAWLAAGRGHFIVHGGEKIWDFAAGSLIASEAGCTVTDLSARPLFPRGSLSSPVLAACNQTIHAQLESILVS